MGVQRLNPLMVPLLLLVFGAIYFSWPLWGLRYTNHDDILFNLYSLIFAHNKMALLSYIAHRQARLQTFINIPIYLGIAGLGASRFYDVLNIASILACYASLIYLLSTFGPVRDAALLVAVVLLLFPLHFYYSFPQGYAVMACWGLCLALLSAGLLGSHLRKPALRKIAASVILFLCSLWGSEYNAVLHPVLLCAPFLNTELRSGRRLIRIGLPYLIVWAASLGAYLAYSILLHRNGADVEGRIVPSFAFVAWLKTVLVLGEKAFLPTALWRGIHLSVATAQGVPEIPPVLTLASFAHEVYDTSSLAVVFFSAWVFCGVALYSQELSKQAIKAWGFVFLSFLLIPCGVLAVSSHYQEIIVAGYIEGHLSTFYSQLGMAGLMVLLLSALCNRWQRPVQRTITVTGCSLVLAGTATLTFVYNNVNRQVMSANRQKWDAIEELVQFVQTRRPDLANLIFNAHGFWTSSGVSVIPTSQEPFIEQNYWTQYSHVAFKDGLSFRDADGADAESVHATYFATPMGSPVVVLYEQNSDGGGVVTLVAPKSVAGTLSYEFADGTAGTEDVEKWVCHEYCTVEFRYERAIQSQSLRFCCSDVGPTPLLAQFLLGRRGEYGLPLAHPQGDLCFGAVAAHSAWASSGFDVKSDWTQSPFPSTIVLRGSYPIEEDGTCWIGQKASIHLKPPFERGVRINAYVPVSLHRSVNAPLRGVTVEARINHRKAASVTANEDTMIDLIAPVPPDLRKGIISLEITVSDVMNMAKAGRGVDQRDLGIVIRRIAAVE